MTPDASLPPADVQRPTPPLTEEELKRHEDRSWLGIPMTPVATRRLIADLRAAQKRIKELETERDNWKADYEEIYHSEFGY